MDGTTLLLVILLLSIGWQVIEFAAIHARYAGVISGSNLMGYTIQQSLYVATRFVMMLMLPCLGLAVDLGVERESFVRLVQASLLLAAIGCALLLVARHRLVAYYQAVIGAHRGGRSFLASFLRALGGMTAGHGLEALSPSALFGQPRSRTVLVQSALVFASYSTGVFIAFYLALMFPDYRAALSQLSGIVGAVGAILLTFFIEPRISSGIDARSADAQSLISALLLGRLFGVAVLSQIMFGAIVLVTA